MHTHSLYPFTPQAAPQVIFIPVPVNYPGPMYHPLYPNQALSTLASASLPQRITENPPLPYQSLQAQPVSPPEDRNKENKNRELQTKVIRFIQHYYKCYLGQDPLIPEELFLTDIQDDRILYKFKVSASYYNTYKHTDLFLNKQLGPVKHTLLTSNNQEIYQIEGEINVSKLVRLLSDWRLLSCNIFNLPKERASFLLGKEMVRNALLYRNWLQQKNQDLPGLIRNQEITFYNSTKLRIQFTIDKKTYENTRPPLWLNSLPQFFPEITIAEKEEGIEYCFCTDISPDITNFSKEKAIFIFGNELGTKYKLFQDSLENLENLTPGLILKKSIHFYSHKKACAFLIFDNKVYKEKNPLLFTKHLSFFSKFRRIETADCIAYSLLVDFTEDLGRLPEEKAHFLYGKEITAAGKHYKRLIEHKCQRTPGSVLQMGIHPYSKTKISIHLVADQEYLDKTRQTWLHDLPSIFPDLITIKNDPELHYWFLVDVFPDILTLPENQSKFLFGKELTGKAKVFENFIRTNTSTYIPFQKWILPFDEEKILIQIGINKQTYQANKSNLWFDTPPSLLKKLQVTEENEMRIYAFLA